MTCSEEEQDNNEPVVYEKNGMVLPEVMSPMTDLDRAALQFYVSMLGDSSEEYVENTTASNAGWDVLVAISEEEGPLADFAEYARKSANPLAMPDVCEAFCPDTVAAISTAA